MAWPPKQGISGCAIWSSRGLCREAERLAGRSFPGRSHPGVQPWLDEQNRLWGCRARSAGTAAGPSSTTWQASIGRWGSDRTLTQAEECGIAMDIPRGQSRPILPTNQLIIVFI